MQPQRKPPESNEIAQLRREAGKWLKDKREETGLSQRALAAAVGLEYYTFISQLESGRGRVPAERYEAYARALNIEPREFAITMMKYNDPLTYELIFGGTQEQASKVDEMERRLRRLENVLGK
ncbi:helix-turn-helix domain-containing protein [uncultured Rhizobium sp.]|uniref:helix-turn-helix domain-containing protein n=1 Tax=uncultured Rhizobium sp. TaxID=155567 RepID=UPI0026188AFA|nr:helix-turn-helix domain-containing protein [uncultured Rhizobium sp.]